MDEHDTADGARASAVAAGALGLALSVAALATHGPKTALSVALGAAVAVGNLVTMSAIVKALVPAPGPDAPAEGSDGQPSNGQQEERTTDHAGSGRRGGAAWGIFAMLKILVLFGGIWLLLTRKVVAPIPLVVGYGVLPLGIAAASLWSSRRRNR